MRFSATLALLFLVMRAWSQAPELKKPTGPYAVVYEVTVALAGNAAKQVSQGSYKIAEDGKILKVDCKLDSGSFTVAFQDGKSLVFNAQQWKITDGLSYGEMDMPLFMPFDFEGAKVFAPIQDYVSQTNQMDFSKHPDLDHLMKDVRDSNLSVRMASDTEGGRLMPARLSDSQNPGGVVHLSVGPPAAPGFEYSYSRFQQGLGVPFPGLISVIKYKRAPNSNIDVVPDVNYTFKLRSLTTDPNKLEVLSFERLVPRGDLVSYLGTNGRHAAVVFDPGQGSLLQQIDNQLALDAKYPPPPEPSWTPSVTIPVVLAGAFAVLAIYFLVKKPKTQS